MISQIPQANSENCRRRTGRILLFAFAVVLAIQIGSSIQADEFPHSQDSGSKYESIDDPGGCDPAAACQSSFVQPLLTSILARIAAGATILLCKFANSACSILSTPSIRYKYLPRLRTVTSYDRKEAMLNTCFEYLDICGLKGDYLEFGVWRGANLVRAFHLAQRFASLSSMRFFGFDSFLGIPELSENPEEAELFPAGTFAESYDKVQKTLKSAKVDAKKVTLVKGWFSDVLTARQRQHLKLDVIALAYIDCDVYESTIPVLDFVTPCLVEGSILVFDDWYCFKNDGDRGQQKALTEWLERNPQWRVTPFKEFGADGRSFIVNRANAGVAYGVLAS